MSPRIQKPDVQIVVTIPAECERKDVAALRAVCDGVLSAFDASEYQEKRDPWGGGYKAYHFTRTVRFVVDAPEPAECVTPNSDSVPLDTPVPEEPGA